MNATRRRALKALGVSAGAAFALLAAWLWALGLGAELLWVARGSVVLSLLGFVTLTCFLMRVAVGLLWSGSRRRWRLHGASRGAALTEFIIIFPVLLMLIVGSIQLSLMFMANAVVDYAAFQASRRAVVTIPEDGDSEEAGCVCPSFGSQSKLESVRDAAAQVTAGISPQMVRLGSGFPSDRLGVDLALGVDEDGRGSDIGRRSVRLLTKYQLYSRYATGVTLVDPVSYEAPNVARCGGSNGCYFYSRMDDVSVIVSYVYPLQVPVAAQIMGRGMFSLLFGERRALERAGVSVSKLQLVGTLLPWRWVVIRGHATLPNEGV